MIYSVLKKANDLSGMLLKIENTYTGLYIEMVFITEERAFEFYEFIKGKLLKE